MYSNYYKSIPKWSQTPYPEQKIVYKGIDCDAGFWPMNYFKYVGNGLFTNNKSRIVNWNIENPKNINFNEELKDVEYIQKKLSEQEIELAKYWGNKMIIENMIPIAMKLASEYNVTQARATRIIAILSKAINDAFIISWYLKYYWDYPRPVQLGKDLKVVLDTPQSPTYPSGYSVAAAVTTEVISYYFPKEREKLIKLSREAAMSRLYGGVNFKADLAEGLKLGKQIGEMIMSEVTKERDVKGIKIDEPIQEFIDVKIMPEY